MNNDDADQSGSNNGDCENGEEKSESKTTTRKIVRVLTVLAYLSSVSLAAIMLSLYYIFLWNPTLPTHSARVLDPFESPFLTSFSNYSYDSSMNNTYPIEREEPRALPLKPITETIQVEPKIEPIIPSEGIRQFWAKTGFFENDKTSTILRKILSSS